MTFASVSLSDPGIFPRLPDASTAYDRAKGESGDRGRRGVGGWSLEGASANSGVAGMP